MSSQRRLFERFASEVKPGQLQWIGIRPERKAPMQSLNEVKALGTKAIKNAKFVRAEQLSERQKRAIAYITDHGHITIHIFETICPDATKRTLQRELSQKHVNMIISHQFFAHCIGYQ